MKILLSALLPWLFFLQTFNPPPVSPDQVLKELQQWHDNHPQEKVFLQSDKEKYLAGTPIWFSVWCALDNMPTFLSKIVYVELVDEGGQVIEKKMFSLNSLASAQGVIDIDNKTKSGNYSLNAYTLWMLNYPTFIFRKNIFIYNSDYEKKKFVKTGAKAQLNFFPEGGDMIEGIENQVAFKANNNTGYPLEVTGTVFNAAGVKAAEIRSEHDGMGTFTLVPAAGTGYTAKVTFGNGEKGEFKLPAGKKEGVTLHVQNTSPSRIFLVVNRSAVNKEKYNKLFAVAQINGLPVYKAAFNLDEGESGASIIKKNLPPGILQVTLFDSAATPLAERLVFVDNHQVIEPVVNVETFSAAKRGQNLYAFKLDSLVSPSITVSVVNASVDPGLHLKENIASAFLLTSDIKGYIHNPGYYFSNKLPATLQHLDLLLMTQGWRRFTWKQIKGEEPIALKYPVETFMSIKGKVTKSDRQEPVKSGFVSMIIKGEDSTSMLSNAFLTDKGEFIIDSLTFKNKAYISYQGTNNNKEMLAVDVTFYPALIDTLRRSANTPQVVDSNRISDRSELPGYLQTGLRKLDTTGVKVLENIIITAKKMSKADSLQKEYVAPFYENSDQTLVIPENRNYVNIWQYLQQNVPGLDINPFQPGGITNITFDRYAGLENGDSDSYYVKFLLNEIPVTGDIIDGLNPKDVALIKIYKGALGFAFGAEAGAISIYTKKGVDAGKAVFDKSYKHVGKLGFSVSREFYSPDYSSYPDINKNIADNRDVLFWKPGIKPSKDGRYIINFHNNDVGNSFKLTIQGMDANGRLIYKEQLLQ